MEGFLLAICWRDVTLCLIAEFPPHF